MVQARGKGFLKVTGILLIIFGALTVIIGLLAIAGSAMIGSGTVDMSAAGVDAGAYDAGTIMLMSVFTVVMGIINLVAGIIGVANANKLEKAQLCFIIGIVLIVLQLIDAVYSTIVGELSIFGIVVGLILPILFVIGANKNKEQFAEMQSQPPTSETGEI